jgi:UDP-glucose 4-epimerase
VIGLTESSSDVRHVAYEEVYEHGIEDMLHRIPSTLKIREAVGWEPERTLDDILADVIAFERERDATPA